MKNYHSKAITRTVICVVLLVSCKKDVPGYRVSSENKPGIAINQQRGNLSMAKPVKGGPGILWPDSSVAK